MNMEQATIALIFAIAGLISAVGIGVRMLFNRMGDLEDMNKKATARIAELEEQQKRVPELERRIGILTDQLGAMQDRLEEAEKTLDGKERELERLVDETAAQKVALKERDAALAAMVVRVETYERALALVGGERAKPDPEPSAPESADIVKQEKERGIE